MKKSVTSSIASIIVSLVVIGYYSVILFVFALAIDLTKSLGGEILQGNVTIIVLFLAMAMILAILCIIYSIIVLVKSKRTQGEYLSYRKSIITFAILLFLAFVCNIVLFIFMLSSNSAIATGTISFVYLICLFLIIMDMIKLNRFSTSNVNNSNSIQNSDMIKN